MKNIFFCALICAFAMSSCKNSGSYSPKYFYGEIAVFNDTMEFYDDAVGRVFRVSPQTNNLAGIKEQYDNTDKEDGIAVYASFAGELKVDGQDTTILIRELERMSYTYPEGMANERLATTYRNDDRELLVLNRDYTYILLKAREDDPTKANTVAEGNWGLVAQNALIFMPKNGKSETYTIMPTMFNSLVNIDKKNRKIFSPTHEDM